MSIRSRRPWPVSRTTAFLIGGALIALVVAVRVPATRGGLFLLAGAVIAAFFVAHDTGYRIRGRRPR